MLHYQTRISDMATEKLREFIRHCQDVAIEEGLSDPSITIEFESDYTWLLVKHRSRPEMTFRDETHVIGIGPESTVISTTDAIRGKVMEMEERRLQAANKKIADGIEELEKLNVDPEELAAFKKAFTQMATNLLARPKEEPVDDIIFNEARSALPG